MALEHERDVAEKSAHDTKLAMQTLRATAHETSFREMLQNGGKLNANTMTKEAADKFEKEMKQMEALVEGLNKENARLVTTIPRLVMSFSLQS